MDPSTPLALTFTECTEREERRIFQLMNCTVVWQRGDTLSISVAKAWCTSGKETGKQNTHKKQNAIERDRKQHCQPVLSRTQHFWSQNVEHCHVCMVKTKPQQKMLY